MWTGRRKPPWPRKEDISKKEKRKKRTVTKLFLQWLHILILTKHLWTEKQWSSYCQLYEDMDGNQKSSVGVVKDFKTALVSLFLFLFIPTVFLGVQEENKWKKWTLKSINDICCQCTCTVKFGRMDRKKRRGDLPCQRMESSIQRMPAKCYCNNPKRFFFQVVFSPGPHECWWFFALAVI